MEGLNNLIIAITMGEPSGVGGEIALDAWTKRSRDSIPFFIIDNPDRLYKLAKFMGIECPIEKIETAADCKNIFRRALPVLPLTQTVESEPGKPHTTNCPAIIESIDKAIEIVKSGTAAAMVTNPISKETLYATGFEYPGHTEYLAEKAGNGNSVMMLVSKYLRVTPVTTHLSLIEALGCLNVESILYCARTIHDALRVYFDIKDPRLVISGLNPHAGEGGHLGTQEINIIRPAVERLISEGISVSGPLSADTMFHQDARIKYDAAICMYHDQALIPAKTLAFDEGVNITLGLSIIRTSPDHGTALDLAGTGRANSNSFISAVNLAGEMAKKKLRKKK